jgi:uncharacterized protein YkwD
MLVRFVTLIGTLTILFTLAGQHRSVVAQTPVEPDVQWDLGDPPTPDMQSLPLGVETSSTVEQSTSDPISAQANQAMQRRAFVPLIARGTVEQRRFDPNDVPAHINYLRKAAGVPPVTFDTILDDNCWRHARYMAEENIIAHDENVNSKWFSTGGQACAKNGNVWLGGEYIQPIWEPGDSVESWIGSIGHRMWLLYPTTPTFGFGFYTAANNRAGGALDVITKFSAGRDSGYTQWPVRYPGQSQTDIPAKAYPITLGWPYFGAVPSVSSASITASGKAIPNTVTTNLPVGHKGILITPTQALPANTTINVTVNGSYNAQAFSYSWSFTTGN